MDNFEALFKDQEHAALYHAIVSRDDRIGSLEKFRERVKTVAKVATVLTPIVVTITLTILFK